jgi:predicted deacylase
VRGELGVGFGADGVPLSQPVTVVRGARPGPALWIDAALHGDEWDGVAAIWALLAATSAEDLCGTLVCVTATHPAALRAMRRTAPEDDLDLNRVFPGAADGPHAEQVAHAYLETVARGADAYVNLHGGRKTSDVMFYAIFRDGGDAVAERSRRLALAVGSSTVWRSQDRWLERSLFDHLARRGIPSLIIEVGGEGKIRPAHTRQVRDGLVGVMRALGMLAGRAPTAEPEVTVRAADFFHCPAGGLWLTDRAPGDRLKRGDVIGRICDVYGDTRFTVRCQAEEGILLSLRTYGATPSGANLGIVGVIA